MSEIEITGEQEERLRRLQDRIERELVGPYGHVRPHDAVEFLLDQYEVDVGSSDDPVAAAAAEVAGSGTDNEPPVRGEDRAETADRDGKDPANVDEGDSDVDEGDSDVDEGDSDVDEGDSDADGVDGDAAGPDAVSGAAADSPMLDAMMNLLDTHDGRWGESSSGDERYEVELPDGTIEPARTKDDVRALLFEHYR